MIATICDITTACVEMTSSLERDGNGATVVDRLEFGVVAVGAAIIVLSILKNWKLK